MNWRRVLLGDVSEVKPHGLVAGRSGNEISVLQVEAEKNRNYSEIIAGSGYISSLARRMHLLS